MHRNTALVIVFLSLIAALLVGVNIGRKISPGTTPLLPSTSPLALASPATTPQPTSKTYSNTQCGVEFTYAPDYTIYEASDSATLTHKTKDERIVFLCGVDFPKPPLAPEKIEETVVASQSALIYHDASAKDSTPVDVVVLNHPTKQIELAFFGFGEAFDELVKTLRFLE